MEKESKSGTKPELGLDRDEIEDEERNQNHDDISQDKRYVAAEVSSKKFPSLADSYKYIGEDRYPSRPLYYISKPIEERKEFWTDVRNIQMKCYRQEGIYRMESFMHRPSTIKLTKPVIYRGYSKGKRKKYKQNQRAVYRKALYWPSSNIPVTRRPRAVSEPAFSTAEPASLATYDHIFPKMPLEFSTFLQEHNAQD
ncbi:hypothetical protein EVAR_30992_1 [Eumeta japonica]|uniref:Uncharacterized protein n=1 Tax=Eumeta variegata TaxID=151549 RepID=A0A4C1W7U1_EUMVA|nr:hypothetical protein EVAR_30992_1 [Eumeta japonica]